MIEVPERELAGLITAAIGRLPKDVIERLVEHKILALYKRQHSVEKIEAEIGRHVAAEFERLGIKVVRPETKDLGSPPGYGER